MQDDHLLAVHQFGHVDVAEIGHRPATLSHDGGEGRQHLLVEPGRVLGRELELEPGGVEGAGAHAEGVEQRVPVVP